MLQINSYQMCRGFVLYSLPCPPLAHYHPFLYMIYYHLDLFRSRGGCCIVYGHAEQDKEDPHSLYVFQSKTDCQREGGIYHMRWGFDPRLRDYMDSLMGR